MKKTSLIFILIVFSIIGFAQQDPNNLKSIMGTVTNSSGMPLLGVNILVKGTNKGTQTDINGQYTIKAKKGGALVFSYVGMLTQEVNVEDNLVVDIVLKDNTEALKEVVVNAEKISRKEKARSYAVTVITSDQISKGGYYNSLSILLAERGVRPRGQTTFSGSPPPLFVLDGAPITTDVTRMDLLINAQDIERIEVIRGIAGYAKYGQRSIGGVVEITTKFKANSQKPLDNNGEIYKYKGNLMVEAGDMETPYIEELSQANSAEEAYSMYVQQKDRYAHLPTYYLDVYNHFKKWKDRNYELKILFNDATPNLNNPEQLKALAYQLEAAKEYQLAINIYTQVLKLFPEDLQSYRDLALVYKEIGLVQESATILNSLKTSEGNSNNSVLQFSTIDDILKNDAAKSDNGLTYDVRIVADWNRYDANINLHVIDPTREICYYENPTTEQGGKLALNMSQGFGPEEFTLKNAKRGNYFVMVNYSTSSEAEKDVPTFLKLTIFKNYGKPTETKEIKVVQLTEPKENYMIAELKI